jgi:hypothetical protein
MRTLLKRLRGIAGLSALLGGVGAVFGMLLIVLMMVLDVGDYGWANVPVGALAFGLLGLLSGAGFGALLSATSNGLSLSEVSRTRVTLLGILTGILPTLLLFVDGVPDFMNLIEVMTPLVLGGGLGGATAFGVVEIARRAPWSLGPKLGEHEGLLSPPERVSSSGLVCDPTIP